MKSLGKPFSNCFLVLFISLVILSSCSEEKKPLLAITPNETIVLLGNNLGARMLQYGYFETEMQLRFPSDSLKIRNMCDPGDTPGFRPHSSRNTPWAFPGAEKFQTELAKTSGSEGIFEYPDQWLSRLETDAIIAFFGYNESFEGKEGLENFKNELQAFVTHTKNQKYNGESNPQVVLVSPIAFEDLSDNFDLPNGKVKNANLKLYSEAIAAIALKNQIPFIDVFTPSSTWYETDDLTIDGSQLNQDGYKRLSSFIANMLTGNKKSIVEERRTVVNKAVNEKNFFWHNDYKIPTVFT